MRFLKNEPYKMFCKTSLDDSEFHVLDLSPKRGRPKIYGNITLLPLYTTIIPVTEVKQRYYVFTTIGTSHQLFRNILRILKPRNDKNGLLFKNN